jgi:hypothetical protein
MALSLLIYGVLVVAVVAMMLAIRVAMVVAVDLAV